MSSRSADQLLTVGDHQTGHDGKCFRIIFEENNNIVIVLGRHCHARTPSIRFVAQQIVQQEAFEKCWAHSPLRAAARRLF